MDVIMDYPMAWAFVATTKPEDHHPQCSWRTTGGALLCDCHILQNEYERLAKVWRLMTIKCRAWVPTYPRPHFCTYKVREVCSNCFKEYCAKHIGNHVCE
jgi:hypothetical protein